MTSTSTEAHEPPDDRIRRGTTAFRLVGLSMVAAGFSTFALMNCVQPMMPVFSESFGISAAEASLALSVNIAMLACLMPVTGALSETLGRKPVMAVSLFVSTILTIASAFATSWPVFLVFRALQGIAFSGVPSVAMAYMAEEIDRRQAGYAIGLYVSGAAIGGMAGRVIAGLILDFGSWHHAMLGIGAVSLISALLFVLLLPPSRHFVPQTVDVWRILQNYRLQLGDPLLRRLYCSGFLLMGSLIAVYNNLSYRLLEAPFALSQSVVGLLFGVYIAGIASSTLAGSMADRFGRRPVLLIAIVITLAGVAAMAFETLTAVVTGLVIFTIGFFAAHSVASGWVSRHATVARAQASSLYLFAYYMGGAIIGWLAGFAWEWAAWHGVSLLVAVALAVCFVGSAFSPVSKR